MKDSLQLELDYCTGRQMEVDNLAKRIDIQINVVRISLPSPAGYIQTTVVLFVHSQVSWTGSPERQQVGCTHCRRNKEYCL